MADNVAVTQGAGTTVATDDAGGAHFQKVKLVDGTADSTAAIPGDATRGLYVNPKGRTTRVSVTPTITAGAYATGDVIGGLMTFAGVTSVSGGGGTIVGIQVFDKAPAVRSPLGLVFFSQSVTLAADNGVWNVSDADMAFAVAQVEIGAWNYNTAFPATVLNSIATVPAPASAATSVQSMAVPYTCAATSLFLGARVIGTPTYGSTTDLTFSLIVVPD